jgi:hypothetical protein
MKTKTTPIPDGYQYDAWHWLEEQGVEARKPPIRSSDYGMCLRDPFRYYLSRRLGLIPPLEWSAALNQGTWFHHALYCYDKEYDEVEQHLRGVLLDRKAEIEEMCREIGKDYMPLWEREEKDMRTAASWWHNACCNIPISKEHGTLREYLNKPCWVCLGREVYLITTNPPSVAQADLLLYNKETNQIWIVDGKTCSVSPRIRLSTCPIEFQTLHYSAQAYHLMDPQYGEGAILQRYFDIPLSATLGGMIHAAVQKCPLIFGKEDRPFTEYEHTFVRGERKGEVEIRRNYEGEPTVDCYLQRQSEWYTGTGRYAHRAAEIADDPPVNLSFTYARSALDRVGWSRYGKMSGLVHLNAARDPVPNDFPMNADNLRPFRGGRLSPYAPFYMMPVQYWPGIIKQDGFRVVDRDEHTPLDKAAVVEQESLE